MVVEEEKKQEFIGRVMYTPLFSISEKIRIIEKLKNGDLSGEYIDQIINLIKHFNDSTLVAINRYYRNIDKVYAQYLNKNIAELKQKMGVMKLKVSEIKSNEEDRNPDLLLNQID